MECWCLKKIKIFELNLSLNRLKHLQKFVIYEKEKNDNRRRLKGKEVNEVRKSFNDWQEYTDYLQE